MSLPREEECPRDLAALRALGMFDPDGDDLAKPLEHRGDLGERRSGMVGETPLAERPVLVEQHGEGAAGVRQRAAPTAADLPGLSDEDDDSYGTPGRLNRAARSKLDAATDVCFPGYMAEHGPARTRGRRDPANASPQGAAKMPGHESAIRTEELRRLAALRWLPAPRLDVLSRRMRALRVKKGEVLYRPGQPAKHIYCVLEGAVGLSLLGSEGRFVQLALATRGEFFGETALVRGWRRVSQALAFQDSRVGQIEAQALVSDVCGLPWEIFAGLTEMVLKPLFLVSLRRSLFLVEALTDRVALALWEYASHPEAKGAAGLLPAIITHEHLAALMGASRPRVSVALKRLERDGLFVREGKQMRVQEQLLRRYLERRYEYLL
jgi:CRP/FNR family cyclic AMP-dependent transcriptional regulator